MTVTDRVVPQDPVCLVCLFFLNHNPVRTLFFSHKYIHGNSNKSFTKQHVLLARVTDSDTFFYSISGLLLFLFFKKLINA